MLVLILKIGAMTLVLIARRECLIILEEKTKTANELSEAYKTNEEFRIYVDGFASGTRKSVNEALRCATVRDVYKMFKLKNKA